MELDNKMCFLFQYVHHGTTGRVAGWGLNENSVGSPVLKMIDLDAVDYNTCKNNVPKFFVPFVTPDKFCASLLSESVCQVLQIFLWTGQLVNF